MQPSLLELNMHMSGETSLLKGILQRPDDASLLWDGPDSPEWVACNQRNTTCFRKVSKQDWYTPGLKTGKCLDVFQKQVREGKVNSSSVGIDICNLNRRTNELCQVRVCVL